MAAQPPANLEHAADAALAAAGSLGRRSGIYSEADLRRKIAYEKRRTARLDETGLPEEAVNYLADSAVEDLIDAAGLSAMQEICFRLHLAGMSANQIARTLNLAHQIVRRRLDAAARKVRKAYADGPYAGWREVYIAEVNRPIYRGRSRAGCR